MSQIPLAEPLVEVKRGAITESRHRGHVVVIEPDGKIIASLGAPENVTFLRSSAKPFQAMPLLLTGAAERFGFTDREVALACGSHNGEPIHTELAASMLHKIGLGPEALRCGAHEPYGTEAARELRERGEQPNALHNNCSGKHAGMLAATMASGWDPASYLDPGHPLQTRITDFLRDTAGPVEPVGVDGCGAPVFATTARAMGRAFARLATGTEFLEVFDAMHSFPALVSGVGNVDAAIATHLDAVGKRGAAGVLGIGLRGRLGLAVKVWDGSSLVAGVAALAALDQLGALTPYASELLVKHSYPRVEGGGRPVGRFEPRLELRWQ